MDINKLKEIKTKWEAVAFAIRWQEWVAEQNLSYGELAEWGNGFEELAKKFHLVEEFKENGII